MTTLRLAFDRSSQRSFDAEGRLHVAGCRLTKSCVSPYLGSEIPDFDRLGLDPDKTYHLLRDPDALRRAVPAFAGLPILSKHQPATADDHPTDIVVGAVGTDVRWEDPWIVASLSFWPASSIERIRSGEARDLSVGYAYRPLMRPGTFEGEHYDGVMLSISPNHVSVVPDGRVEGAMVGDAAPHLGFDSTHNPAFHQRSTKMMRFGKLRHVLFLAADSAAREHRRARDEEEELPPTDEELSEAPADADACLAIIKTMLADLPRAKRRKFCWRALENSPTQAPPRWRQTRSTSEANCCRRTVAVAGRAAHAALVGPAIGTNAMPMTAASPQASSPRVSASATSVATPCWVAAGTTD